MVHQPMARILIPDCLAQSAFATIRCLARAGDRCEVAWRYGRARRLLAGRFVRAIHRVESAEVDPEAYASQILSLCRDERFDVVMPLYLDTVRALVPRREELLLTTRALLPTQEQLLIADDKLRTALHCESIGIVCPRVLDPVNDGDVEAVASDLEYPVVLKRRSGAGVEHGLRYAPSRDALLRARDELVGDGNALFLQEFVPGYIHDVCALARDGRVVQTLTQVRKLMYPITGGVGAVNFTTHNAAAAALARELLESLGWNGPAQVEFKLDERDGRLKLIELNPKFWGTLDLAIRVGVDFPVQLRDLLLGRPVRERSYAAGVRYRFWFDRGLAAYLQLVRESGLHGARDSQHYTRTFRDFDPWDPLPDVVRAANSVVGIVRGRSVPRDPGLPAQFINPMRRSLPVAWPMAPRATPPS